MPSAEHSSNILTGLERLEKDISELPPLSEDANSSDVAYSRCKFWSSADWSQEIDDAATDNSARPDKWGFLTDLNGNVVSGERKQQMWAYADELFGHIHYLFLSPSTWSSRHPKVELFFRTSMYARFSELRLCSGHWKVQRLGSIRWTEKSRSLSNKPRK